MPRHHIETSLHHQSDDSDRTSGRASERGMGVAVRPTTSISLCRRFLSLWKEDPPGGVVVRSWKPSAAV